MLKHFHLPMVSSSAFKGSVLSCYVWDVWKQRHWLVVFRQMREDALVLIILSFRLPSACTLMHCCGALLYWILMVHCGALWWSTCLVYTASSWQWYIALQWCTVVHCDHAVHCDYAVLQCCCGIPSTASYCTAIFHCIDALWCTVMHCVLLCTAMI